MVAIHFNILIALNTELLAFSDDDNGRAIVGYITGQPLFVFKNSVEPGKNLQLRNITRVSSQQFEDWSSQCN